MTENQNLPWKRLAAEAIAIVASILLAFAIDAAWDERNERMEEKEVLRSLQLEFEANRDEAANVVLTHERALRYGAELMSLSDDEVLALSAREVERHVGYMAHPRTFDAVRGSVDALTSSGKLGILQDRSLRDALTTFVNFVEDAHEDREYMSLWAMIIWQEIARNGGPYFKGPESSTIEQCADLRSEPDCYRSNLMSYLPAATAEDLLRLRKNTVLIAYVNRSHESSARYASEILQTRDQIEKILALIEQNL